MREKLFLRVFLFIGAAALMSLSAKSADAMQAKDISRILAAVKAGWKAFHEKSEERKFIMEKLTNYKVRACDNAKKYDLCTKWFDEFLTDGQNLKFDTKFLVQVRFCKRTGLLSKFRQKTWQDYRQLPVPSFSEISSNEKSVVCDAQWTKLDNNNAMAQFQIRRSDEQGVFSYARTCRYFQEDGLLLEYWNEYSKFPS